MIHGLDKAYRLYVCKSGPPQAMHKDFYSFYISFSIFCRTVRWFCCLVPVGHTLLFI